ncbi:MAG: hypothetical protein LUC91_11590 [Prevotella sp.]|nr:hypothetical protein [Prevotella sp.]
MIYLIDDSRLKDYNAEYVLSGKYRDILCVVQNVEEFERHVSDMSQAECIMIHNTFAKSYTFKERVAEISDYGDKIPFVCFSGSDSEIADFSLRNLNFIRTINKGIFYGRLQLFLDSFIQTHKVNLLLLAYGKNYMYTFVHKWVLNIMQVTNGMNGKISEIDLAKITGTTDFKKIVDASAPSIGQSYDDLLNNLMDNPITIDAFRNNLIKIENSFNQYGKNIYTWK